jgi:integrase
VYPKTSLAGEVQVMYGLLVRNPAHGAAFPIVHQQEMSVWDEAQVLMFLTAASGSYYEALYHLAVVTGMRQGELFGLKWSDLQWNTGMLYIQRQGQRVPGKGWSFIEPKTRAAGRPIRLGPGTIDVLRRHKERHDLEREAVGKRWVNNNLVFPNGVGNPMEPSNMRLDFNRVLEEAGLPKIRFHDLRHTAASLMLNNNIPPLVVSRILGHSRPSTTMDIYAHLYHASLNEAAMLMDQLVTPIKVELTPQKAENPRKKDSLT